MPRHIGFAFLHKLKVSCRRSRVAFAEFVTNGKAVLREVAYDRHVAFLALVAVVRRVLLSLDSCRVDIKCVRLAGLAPQYSAIHRAIDPLKTR